MKITLGLLELARKNPAAFKQQRLSGEDMFKGGTTYVSVLTHGIMSYHSKGYSEAQIVQQMQSKFDKSTKLNSQQQINKTINRFHEYVSMYEAEHNLSTNTRVKLIVPLPSGCGQHEVTGTLSRLDMTKNGTLTGWQYCGELSALKNQLRFPIIQFTLATCMDFDVSEVTVGAYCFQIGQYIPLQYSQQEIDSAFSELCALLPLL